MLVFSYLVSFAFKNYDSVYRVGSMIYQMAAMIPAITVMILSYINEDTRKIAKAIHYIFGAIDPPYTLMGTLNFIGLFPLERMYQLKGEPTSADYFEEPTIYIGYIYSVIQIIICGGLVYYLDFYRYFSRRAQPNAGSPKKSNDTELIVDEAIPSVDDDVYAEKKLIDSIDKNSQNPNDVVVIRHLGKEYTPSGSIPCRPSKLPSKVAVEDLCLRVQLGECFGLLGPNGAGKSTSLSMMTGDNSPTSGTVLVDGHDILKNLSATYEVTGYCPQHDPFPPDLVSSLQRSIIDSSF